ncbi:MAG: TonB-dependent receptor domain-containing protein [Steroidobacter sp.]
MSGGYMRALSATLALSAAIAGGLAFADAPSVKAPPSDPAREFNIAAQPLSQALRAYAEQSGDQIVFYSDVGRGRESTPVEGRYTAQQALQKLLENTGLKHERVNSKTVAISVAKEKVGRPDAVLQRSSTAAPLRLAQATPPPASPAPRRSSRYDAQRAEDSLFGVEEVIVTGAAVAERTKFGSSVAISTFNAADIAQQAPSSSADLISAVPGFWVESTAGTTQGNVFARGIIQDGGYKYVGLMEDGIPIYPVSELSFYNPDQFVRVDATIERVEALRGGTAPIFTSGAIGGVVNFVTRSATPNPGGAFKLGLSDYGMYRSDFAWSGPLGDEWGDDWGVAFGGYYRQSDGVREPGYTADDGGQFRVKLSRSFERGDLDVFAKYIDDRSLFVVPIPLTGDPSDPNGLNGADPGTYSLHSEDLARARLPASAAQLGLQGSSLENGIHPQLATIGARFSWKFSDIVSLSNLVRWTGGDVRFDGIFPGEAPTTGVAFAAANGGFAPNFTVLSTGASYAATSLVQNHGHWVVDKEYDALQDDLRLNFYFEPHAFTLGLYLADYSMADRWSLGNLLLMDVSNQPRRLFLPGVTDPDGYTQYSFFNLIADYDATAFALYAADEWQATDALRFDFGVRYDDQQTEGSLGEGVGVDLDGNPLTRFDNAASQVGSARRRIDESFDTSGYSIGFNYELTPSHAVFGHYTDSARLPNFDDFRNAPVVNGRPDVEKDNVTNLELGYKTSLDTLVLFAALFQTEFDNISFRDILASGAEVRRRAGTRTRGIELEGEYAPLEVLNVRFSATFQEPEYTSFRGATVDFTGNTIRRIPEVMTRVTPTLLFMEDRGRVYLTYSYFGERFANDENSIELPSYTKLDAGVMFDVGENWSFQISGDNLTDEVGLTEGNPRTDLGAGGIGAIYMVRPLFGRSFMGSMTFRY